MKLEPTQEQSQIINEVLNLKEGECLSIKAFAGAAKTTTLKMIAEAMPNTRFLYLAFNKAIVEDCKSYFPKNVDIKTTHALAYAHAVKGKKIGYNLRIMEVAKKYHINYESAAYVIKTLDFFFNGDLDSLASIEVPESLRIVANQILNEMRQGSIDITHSFYLKEFEQMLKAGFRPKIYADIILLDEAQDTNPVTISIFNQLAKKRVVVGDSHQQIYGFRMSVNAMDMMDGKKMWLSTTFRCLPEIVDRANWILSTFKGEVKKIVSGNNKEDFDIQTNAYISRSNSRLIFFMNALDKFNLTRAPELIFECALGIYYWGEKEYEKIPSAYKFLCNSEFKDIDELASYALANEDAELKNGIKVVEEFKHNLLDILDKAKKNYANNGMFDTTLTTAHSAKGLEFDKVYIADDMTSLTVEIAKLIAKEQIESLEDFYTSDNAHAQKLREEVNLYYVATTRAKYILEDHSQNAADMYDEVETISSAINSLADTYKIKVEVS